MNKKRYGTESHTVNRKFSVTIVNKTV